MILIPVWAAEWDLCNQPESKPSKQIKTQISLRFRDVKTRPYLRTDETQHEGFKALNLFGRQGLVLLLSHRLVLDLGPFRLCRVQGMCFGILNGSFHSVYKKKKTR